MKLNWYCYAAGGMAAITSPGIAYAEELPDATGCLVQASPLQTIQYQNRVLRSQADWRDRILGSFHGFDGSGSSSEADRVWFETTSYSPEEQRVSLPTEAVVASIVAEIRSTLSLNVKELAEILKVQRPTIYAWMRGEQKPQGENRRRLSQLARVARLWLQMSNLPLGTLVRESLDENGRSLVDAFAEENIDYGSIESRMKSILDSMEPRKKTVLDLARETGMDLSGVKDQRDLVDVVTGKRMHEE